MWAANAGCSIGQIKALKGHKVDNAVKDASNYLMLCTTKLLMLWYCRQSHQNAKQNVTMKQKALSWLRQDQTKNEMSNIVYNITMNGTLNGPLSFNYEAEIVEK